MKLLGSTKKDVDKNKYGEDVPKIDTVISSITVISKHLKYCLLLYLINNLVR